MSIEIASKTDLNNFKIELIKLITQLLSKYQSSKEILSNDEVIELLGISKGTLRNYRIKGMLSYSKVDGLLYYKYKDIINLIDSNKRNSLSPNKNGAIDWSGTDEDQPGRTRLKVILRSALWGVK